MRMLGEEHHRQRGEQCKGGTCLDVRTAFRGELTKAVTGRERLRR